MEGSDPTPPEAGETIWVREPNSPLSIPYAPARVVRYVLYGIHQGKMIVQRIGDAHPARRIVDPDAYPHEWCRGSDFRLAQPRAPFSAEASAP